MNWIDWFVLIILIVITFQGSARSAVSQLCSLMVFVVAFACSLQYYPLLSSKIELIVSLPLAISKIAGFVIINFVAGTILYTLIFKTLQRINMVKIPNDVYFSSFFAFLRGIAVVAIILTFLNAISLQSDLKDAIKQSTIAGAIFKQTGFLNAPFEDIFASLSDNQLKFITVKPAADENVNIGFTLNNFSVDEKMETIMFDLVNKERQTRNLKALKFDSALVNLARDHSADMFKRGYFAHYSPEGKNVALRVKEQGISYHVIAENLAYAPTIESAHQGLMASPGHKENILSQDFEEIGIGVQNGRNRGLMITQIFKKR